MYTSSCTYDHTLVVGTNDSYPVVSSSTCSYVNVGSSTDPVQYPDFAFFGVVVVFLLTFVPMSIFWSVFKHK